MSPSSDQFLSNLGLILVQTADSGALFSFLLSRFSLSPDCHSFTNPTDHRPKQRVFMCIVLGYMCFLLLKDSQTEELLHDRESGVKTAGFVRYGVFKRWFSYWLLVEYRAFLHFEISQFDSSCPHAC